MQLATVALSGADRTGRVYQDGEMYLRLIAPEAERWVRELFSSGLVQALVERSLLPESTLIDTPSEASEDGRYRLAVRHTALIPLVYPSEWSFAMLQTAALQYLELVEVAFSYGYTLADAHPFNFVFQGITPVWVDLGSLCKISPELPHPWLEEFLAGYMTPLRMWCKSPFIARKIISSPFSALTLAESIRLNFLPWGNGKITQKMCAVMKKLSCIDNAQSQKFPARLAKLLFKKNTPQRLASLKTKVRAFENAEKSQWGSYHKEFLVNDVVPCVLDDRFEQVYKFVNEVAPKSILELAGNAGVLSETIARRMPEISVTCTDYDTQAIDALFLRMQKYSVKNMNVATLNFMCTECSSAEQEPYARLKSDCVLALAVTHHLLLTQGYSFGEIFSTIKKYSNNTVFIEYMPLGLYDGNKAKETPAWYTESNFQHAFEEHFFLHAVDRLEENRILFRGSVK